MTIRFPEASNIATGQAELPEWPQWLLDRYGARMLHPNEVVRAPGAPVPRSTVYRTAILLFPRGVLADGVLVPQIEQALSEIGLTIRLPNGEFPSSALHPALAGLDDNVMADVPIPVVIRVGAAGPAVVDAWAALQQIRARVSSPNTRFERISLEHLLVGTNYGGVPTWSPHDVRPSSFGSPYRLMPVAFRGTGPVRQPTPPNGRRVVAAVLDTGLVRHPLFGNAAPGSGLPSGGFVREFTTSANAIAQQNKYLNGLTPTNILLNIWEAPVYGDVLTEEIGRATGHCCFISGLIHQGAPDADVLVTRVMQTDNICREADLLLALWLIVARVTAAQKPGGNISEIVDIVSLSLGGYVESTSTKASNLRTVIMDLTGRGVLVVAAAGNDATTREFYPAALATEPNPWPGQRVLGVGALNPDDTTAWFSNAGPNITIEATGACMISTFPPDVKGSHGTGRRTESGGRQTADPDKFSGAWAMGSGTSYAVAHVVARAADLLSKDPTITTVDAASMRTRAINVVQQLP